VVPRRRSRLASGYRNLRQTFPIGVAAGGQVASAKPLWNVGFWPPNVGGECLAGAMNHPVLSAYAAIDAAFDEITHVDPANLTVEQKKVALTCSAKARARAEALEAGSLNLAQARVIAEALDALPKDLPPALLAKAEVHLVEKAAEFGPRDLTRLGQRVLEVIAPEIAEQAEPDLPRRLHLTAQQEVWRRRGAAPVAAPGRGVLCPAGEPALLRTASTGRSRHHRVGGHRPADPGPGAR
jgi:Domain of unknown function (DUF222)